MPLKQDLPTPAEPSPASRGNARVARAAPIDFNSNTDPDTDEGKPATWNLELIFPSLEGTKGWVRLELDHPSTRPSESGSESIPIADTGHPLSGVQGCEDGLRIDRCDF